MNFSLLLEIQPPLKYNDKSDFYRTKAAIVVEFRTAYRKNSVIMNLKELSKKIKSNSKNN